MSQRFAADQALQVLQSIALESSDGEYSDSESDKVNNVIANIQNEEALLIWKTNMQTRKHQPTQMIVLVLEAAVIMMNKPFWTKTDPTGDAQFPPKSLQDDYSSTILLESMQNLHDISHPASYAAVLFLRSASFSTSPCSETFRSALLKRHIVPLETAAERLL